MSTKEEQVKDTFREEEKAANSVEKTGQAEDTHTDTASDEFNQAKEEITRLEKQLNERQELFLRAKADLENYRRRARKEKEEALKYAGLPLLESLLPVLDNFERAFSVTGGEKENKESFYEGMQMVYRQLTDALTRYGLEKVEAVSKPFDPHIHNAVVQEDHEEYESGIVIEELQAGYRYHERVVRPSMVKVSK